MDQEREYKNQISALETKAHEQWVIYLTHAHTHTYIYNKYTCTMFFYKVAARQNERRLEESKAEAGQLRNRLTLVEKNLNLNDTDPEAKLHRKYFYYIYFIYIFIIVIIFMIILVIINY